MIINLTIATLSGQPMVSAVNLVRKLHLDDFWNINFIELVEDVDNSGIFKKFKCAKNSPFVAINGQAVLYGFGEMHNFLARLISKPSNIVTLKSDKSVE